MAELENITKNIENAEKVANVERIDNTHKEALNNSAAAVDNVDEAAKPAELTSPTVEENKKTPAKRTPKRMSFIERAQKESEELVRNMGGSLELEGGRRTRSSTRGTPSRSTAVTPPPAKKPRGSPVSANTTPNRARGRGRRIDISTEENTNIDTVKVGKEKSKETEQENNNTENVSEKQSSPTKAKTASAIEENRKENEKSAAENSKEKTEEQQQVSQLESVDKTDAAVESISEGQHNNIDHSVNAEKKAQQDKDVIPMETDDEPATTTSNNEDVKANSAATISVEEAKSSGSSEAEPLLSKESKIEKETSQEATSTEATSTIQTTIGHGEAAQAVSKHDSKVDTQPEPMEVDSSSKSNDNVDTSIAHNNKEQLKQDGKNKAVDNVVETSEAEAVVEQQNTVSEQQQLITPENAETELVGSATSGLKTQENTIESTATVTNATSKAVSVEQGSTKTATIDLKKSVEKTGVTVALTTTANTETNAAVSNDNKSDNELGEPKITSPSNEAAAVPTPQFCN